MHFSSTKKVRLKKRWRRKETKRENTGTKRRRETIPKRRTYRCKGPGLSHSCPNTRNRKITAIGRTERKERGV